MFSFKSALKKNEPEPINSDNIVLSLDDENGLNSKNKLIKNENKNDKFDSPDKKSEERTEERRKSFVPESKPKIGMSAFGSHMA